MTKRLSFLRRVPPGVAAALVALHLWPVPSAWAQTQAPEPELKAAIISNMLLFVEWPPAKAASPMSAPEDQLVVCYQNASPVADALRRLDGKSVKGKLLKVMQASDSDISRCHAIYVAPGNVANLESLLPALAGSPVLVAADSPEYSKRGVMLNLDLAGGRVVFDIDLRAAQKAGLQISSKALRLARQVID